MVTGAGTGLGNGGNPVCAGIDIGGTNTRVGLFDENFLLLGQVSFPTPKPAQADGRPEQDPSGYLDRIAEAVRELGRQHGGGDRIRCVGIGVPGNVDPYEGVVRDAVNLGWERIDLAAEMASRLDRHVVVEHDVRCFVAGEANAGAGAGCRHLIGVTVGTGIGAGIAVDGAVVRGASWRAGEIGHDAVDGESAPCNCGKRGCLETIASAPGIERMAAEAIRSGAPSDHPRLRKGNLSAHEVYLACLEGDRTAAEVFRRAGTALGRKLATLVFALNPERIVIGGGVAEAGEYLLGPVRDELRRHIPDAGRLPSVSAGRLGGAAVMAGAARTALQLMRSGREKESK